MRIHIQSRILSIATRSKFINIHVFLLKQKHPLRQPGMGENRSFGLWYQPIPLILNPIAYQLETIFPFALSFFVEPSTFAKRLLPRPSMNIHTPGKTVINPYSLALCSLGNRALSLPGKIFVLEIFTLPLLLLLLPTERVICSIATFLLTAVSAQLQLQNQRKATSSSCLVTS